MVALFLRTLATPKLLLSCQCPYGAGKFTMCSPLAQFREQPLRWPLVHAEHRTNRRIVAVRRGDLRLRGRGYGKRDCNCGRGSHQPFDNCHARPRAALVQSAAPHYDRPRPAAASARRFTPRSSSTLFPANVCRSPTTRAWRVPIGRGCHILSRGIA